MNAKDVDLSFLNTAEEGGNTLEDFQRNIPLKGDTIHVYRHCQDDTREMKKPERYQFPNEEERSQWQLVKTLKQEDYCRDVRVQEDDDGYTDNTLLVASFKWNVPQEIVEYIYRTDPDAVRKRNNRTFGGGQLPLPILRLLIEAYPEALRTSAHGFMFLPLHFHICVRAPSLEEFQFVADSYPQALAVESPLGFPLHRACEIAVPNDLIQYIVSRCPEALHLKSADRTPGDNPRRLPRRIPVEYVIHSGRAIGRLETLMILVRPAPETLLDSDAAREDLQTFDTDIPGSQVRDKILEFAEMAKKAIDLRGMLEWMSANCDSMGVIQNPARQVAQSDNNNDNDISPPTAKRRRNDNQNHHPSMTALFLYKNGHVPRGKL